MATTFESIDIAKLVGSVLIFSMHCGVFNDFQNLGTELEVLSRWAVPFFFICSSYFLFRKNDHGSIEKASVQYYIKRIASLYCVWLIFNLPNVFYYRLYFSDLSAIGTWLIFIKNSVLSSTFTGSWYLTSCIFSALLIYWLSTKLKTGTILMVTFIMYLMCVFTSAYQGLLPDGVVTVLRFLCFPRNVFNGCFYFAVGKYLCEHAEQLKNVFPKTICMAFVLGFYILDFVELYILKRLNLLGSTDVTFSITGVSFFLFLFCIQSHVGIRNSCTLRKLSTIIYCCQGNVLLVNGFCKRILGLSSIASYVVSSATVALICMAVLYLQKKNRWKWTKHLT